jgi:hypothetical protein
MQGKTRQETIINYLRVKPSNHGEVETVLLFIPEREKIKSEISTDERKLIEETFKEQGTNLIPIIVRRTQPDEEDREYEVVYGQKWCIVAEEIGIDRLWTWVFDLKDSEIPLIQEKMSALAGNQTSLEPAPSSKTSEVQMQETTQSSDSLVKAIEINLEPSLLTELKAGNIQVNIEIKPNIQLETKSTSDLNNKTELNKNYDKLSVEQLKQLAKDRGLSGYSKMKKAQLVKLHKNWDNNQQSQ